jgi:hypothetical protein
MGVSAETDQVPDLAALILDENDSLGKRIKDLRVAKAEHDASYEQLKLGNVTAETLVIARREREEASKALETAKAKAGELVATAKAQGEDVVAKAKDEATAIKAQSASDMVEASKALARVKAEAQNIAAESAADRATADNVSKEALTMREAVKADQARLDALLKSNAEAERLLQAKLDKLKAATKDIW